MSTPFATVELYGGPKDGETRDVPTHLELYTVAHPVVNSQLFGRYVRGINPLRFDWHGWESVKSGIVMVCDIDYVALQKYIDGNTE